MAGKGDEPLIAINGAPQSSDPNARIPVIVTDTKIIADGTLQITFQASTGASLPAWTPGAHIDVPVGENDYRQYSLCSDPDDTHQYQIAVLRKKYGSGGSIHVHKNIKKGTELGITVPRNHFPLLPAKRHLFLAGGIGITPILPLFRAAKAANLECRLIYLGSRRQRMAFIDDLSGDPNVTIWPRNENNRFDLRQLLDGFKQIHPNDSSDLPNALVYACGPPRMLAALEALELPPKTLITERFENTALDSAQQNNKPFDVELRRGGRWLHVPANGTLLEILNESGCDVWSMCQKGVCGTCVVGVLDGDVEHRDAVLSTEEKDSGKKMMVCVSRSAGQKLALDLW